MLLAKIGFVHVAPALVFTLGLMLVLASDMEKQDRQPWVGDFGAGLMLASIVVGLIGGVAVVVR